MSASLVSTPIRVCAVCDAEVEETPGVCFSCKCGSCFTLTIVSADPQLGLQVVVPELPGDGRV